MKMYPLLLSIACALSLYCNEANEPLTLDQKIGQLFMVTLIMDEAAGKALKSYPTDKTHILGLIYNYHIGGIIYLGKNRAVEQKAFTNSLQNFSPIPLLVGQDLEPGRVGKSRIDTFHFPSNQFLGQVNSAQYTTGMGRAIGNLCAYLGVHINFAPVADVNNNPDNPVINDRSFGDNPDLVATHAQAFIDGIAEKKIISCAKHFPGHGDTTVDSHVTLPVINHDIAHLNAIELAPFKHLIENNVPAIMIGHLVVPSLEQTPALPASLSRSIVTDFLRNTLGFKGLIITDALDMGALADYTDGEAELQALLAGNDILLCPINVPAAVEKIKQAIQDGRITEEEIDEHVERIMTVKRQFFVIS